MKNILAVVLTFILITPTFAQQGQLSINRIAQMPSLPTPYAMRNWKEVTTNYDALIFSTTLTGQFLPLIDLKPTGINYPELSPILLDTYVGTTSANQAEAINILPAIVGASLVGINKSNQSNVNWVEKTKDFFNKANGQHVYLNGYTTTSGGDWWYDIMPNIFFYQVYAHYPAIPDFDSQFISVADRWLEAVHSMGGATTPWTVPQMNYRAWNLESMTGNADGVKEPEAAGGIAWLLYHAYFETGEIKYLKGAEMSLEFLSSQTSNPSYELQLPYGAFIAAKMNAEQGTNYDVGKLLNWCFDRGPLRGWGSIVGTWNGSDVSGLIGEANDTGNDYAFVMNGFQQAAALVPLIKYDKRYARAIAKWTLNVANASRLFYPQFLPTASQDDFSWSSTNDANASIAYEALKEIWEGKPLYGTGDAKRNGWAQTNLSLYSSSHVGYLAAVVETTEVEGILLLDLNRTDFFERDNFPTYALYNPHPVEKQVLLTLPPGQYTVYDAISENTLAANASGTTLITIPTDEVVMIVYIPSTLALQPNEGKLYADTKLVDHHYGYTFDPPLRIKSLAVTDTLVAFHQAVSVYSSIENVLPTAIYTWLENSVTIASAADNAFTWTVPETPGKIVLKLQVASGGKTVEDSIVFNVVEKIPIAPIIHSITSPEKWYALNSEAIVSCNATDDQETPDALTYQWIIAEGTILNQQNETLTWQLPAIEGIYEVTCVVTDSEELTATLTKEILVKKNGAEESPTFAYYPLNGDTRDYSGNSRHAEKSGVEEVPDVRGEAANAYSFNSGSDIIFLDNSAALNFREVVTLSFWIRLNSLQEESFILSHGSWEERFKVSVTPTGYIRWTVKTSAGTKDLDSSIPLILNQFYHIVVVYSGYSMELYVDGALDTVSMHTGLMNTSNKSLTFGRKDENETNYFLRGILDEVRVHDRSLTPDEIATLPNRWDVVTSVEHTKTAIQVFPNPNTGNFHLTGIAENTIKSISIVDLQGRAISHFTTQRSDDLYVTIPDTHPGLYVVRIQTNTHVINKKILVN